MRCKPVIVESSPKNGKSEPTHFNSPKAPDFPRDPSARQHRLQLRHQCRPQDGMEFLQKGQGCCYSLVVLVWFWTSLAQADTFWRFWSALKYDLVWFGHILKSLVEMHWSTTFFEDGHIMESKLCPLSVIFRQGQQLRFWSVHTWDLVFVVFWVLCLSVIFKTDLGFFVSDAFQAADSEVVVASRDRGHLMLSGRFNSDAILVWDTGEGSADMISIKISRYDMTFGVLLG